MFKRALLALSVATALATTIQPGQAAPITQPKLKSTLEQLGYKVDASDGELAIEAAAKSGIYLHFRIGDEGQSLFLYSYWTVPADKREVIPTVAMLKANSGATFTFALFDNNKDLAMDLGTTLDGNLVTNARLRQAIDKFIEAVETNDELVDSDKWTSTGSKPALSKK